MKKLLIAFVGLALAFTASAEVSPIGLGIFTPMQFPEESNYVYGLRLKLYARHAEVRGLDFGFGNHVRGDFYGLQLSPACNFVCKNVYGAQVAIGSCFSLGELNGVAFASYNDARGGINGVQLGILNISRKQTSGVQFGIVNYSTDMSGVQIGLVNIIYNSTLPVFPFINAHW